MDGTVVVVGAGVVGVAALVLIGAAATKEKSQKDRGINKQANRSSANLETPSRRGRGAVSSGVLDDADVESLRQALIVPPPDEARIEAIPPKNDMRSMGGTR